MKSVKLFVLLVGFVSIVGAQWDQFPVHPSYDLVNLKHTDFNAKTGGMAWLSDGRMVFADFGLDIVDGDPGSNRPKLGKIFILDNLASENPNQITRTEIATGLWQPLGLAVVEDKIYVAEKDRISVFAESSPGVFDSLPNEYLTGWDFDNIWGQWAMGLAYKDSAFYLSLAVGWQGAPHPDASSGRASVIKVTLDNKVSVVASGFRSHNGIGFGPGGDLFITENNGRYVPTEYLAHVKQGHFYGMVGAAENMWEFSTGPYQAPAVYIPHWEMGASPSSPHLLKNGIFKGQLLITDYRWGQIGRYFLEKVKGDWQGAVYRFSGGFEAGPHRILMSPNESDIYVGGLGGMDPSKNCGNWCWKETHFGFQKLKKKMPEVIPFEILSTRSRNNGLEFEFTHPVNTSGVQNSAFTIEQWGYTIEPGYGAGQKTNNETLSPIGFQFSLDNRKLFVEIGGLKESRLVHVAFDSSLTSETGAYLWDNHSYYTQNNISPSEAFDIHGCMQQGFAEYNPDATFDDGSCLTGVSHPKILSRSLNAYIGSDGNLKIETALKGMLSLKLFDLKGNLHKTQIINRTHAIIFENTKNLKGIYLLQVSNQYEKLSKSLFLQ